VTLAQFKGLLLTFLHQSRVSFNIGKQNGSKLTM
jgi:hypothetical protein